jgi:hypothetical protein
MTLLYVIPPNARYVVRELELNEGDNRILPSYPYAIKSVKVDYLQAYEWLEFIMPKKNCRQEYQYTNQGSCRN